MSVWTAHTEDPDVGALMKVVRSVDSEPYRALSRVKLASDKLARLIAMPVCCGRRPSGE